MRIGIMTYHHTTNFGSLLQTYGLYKCVTDLGVDCEIIDYHNPTIDHREEPLQLRNCQTLRDFVHYFVREPAKRRKAKRFDRFISQKMMLSRERYIRENVSQCKDKYDVFLVGSDLVWDFSINGDDISYMLDFVKDKRKIAYASSVGGVWKEKEKVSELLGSFSYIGVREETVANVLTEWIGRRVDFVCDPTMLLPAGVWREMAASRIISEKYVLCYFTDKDGLIYKEALEYGRRHNLPVYVIAYHRIPKGLKAIHPVSVEEFLSLILHAESVFTASYHGMLFSLYFEKNFYYYNRGWKARMESIADYLDVEDREGYHTESEIDYERVNAKIEAFRNRSVILLKEYIMN